MVPWPDTGRDPDRAAYLDFRARCEQVFTPFAPIELPDFFVGRRDEIDTLVTELGAPGRQVAIYGDRGVGKTSLAMLCSFFANRPEEDTYFMRCTREMTYKDIFGELLRDASAAYVPDKRETTKSRRHGLRARYAEISRGSNSKSTERILNGAFKIGPGLLLSIFGDTDGLLIVDEFDRVQDEDTHVRMAETLKQFSDARSRTKILVVGVADSLSNLLRAHSSLARSVAEIRLDRMKVDELGAILDRGEERLKIAFSPEVRRRIVHLADGFAHYAHLLARSATLLAAPEKWSPEKEGFLIEEADYLQGLKDATSKAELTLRGSYERAIIPLKKKTQLFQYAVWGAAMAEEVEVHVGDIAGNMANLTGSEVKPQSITYHLSKLVGPDRGGILRRVREGFYKFSDPLMRGYVRLQLEAYNIVERGGQLAFPFMRAGRGRSQRGWAPVVDV
ncbi:MAG TPA: AAA family ATPase [Phycisphaerae bacterium]|nr:AAA family ATPase [Phycisphaerae bacterium]